MEKDKVDEEEEEEEEEEWVENVYKAKVNSLPSVHLA